MAESVLVGLAFLALCSALKLPDYLKQCSRNDPDINHCATRNAISALPRLIKGDDMYDVPLLDPLLLDSLKVHELGLALNGYEVYAFGLKDAVVKNVSFDFNNQTVYIELQVPKLGFRGKYEVHGKIISLPIFGKGDFYVMNDNALIKYKAHYQLTRMVDRKFHMELLDHEMDMKPENFHVEIGNLFNGNKQLGDLMNNFINTNWRLVLHEIGKPVFNALGLMINRILKPIFTNIPYKEIFYITD